MFYIGCPFDRGILGVFKVKGMVIRKLPDCSLIMDKGARESRHDSVVRAGMFFLFANSRH